jgi:hypothetical protein
LRWPVVATVVAVSLLGGCSGAPIMKLDVSDYRDVFGNTNDEQILVNILRAKDNAPVHFSELATLGANIQQTASLQAAVPFGELYGSSNRASAQGVLGLQNNPSLSLSSLETQSFTAGLMSPVKATLIKQFFDEGIDQRLLMILFFSSITLDHVTYLNNSKCDVTESRCRDHFFNFLREIDDLASTDKISANVYAELSPIGAPVSSTSSLKDLAGIDTLKYRILVLNEKDSHGDRKAQVFSISAPQLALCRQRQTADHNALLSLSAVPLFGTPNRRYCTDTEVYSWGGVRRANGLAIRSTYEIIQFLGQILKIQETESDNNRCLKLAGDPHHYTCADQDVLFQVNSGVGEPLVTTNYRGARYSVSLGPCDPKSYCDHSAEVMKILSVLINVNKSASDIPQVPLVRIQ